MNWKTQKVKGVAEVEHLYFYNQGAQNIVYKQVPLSQVTGSTYFGAYVGRTWQEMRDGLKRTIVTEANFNKLIDHPKENGVDEVVFRQFGKEYFIVNGHHRTCIAKFEGRQSVFVQVHEHPFEHELFGLYQRLGQYGIQVELVPFPNISSIRSPIWRLSLPAATITTHQKEGITSFLSYYEYLRPSIWEKYWSLFDKQPLLADTYYQWYPDKVDVGLRRALLQCKK